MSDLDLRGKVAIVTGATRNRYRCGPHARWISGDVLLMTGGEVRRAAD